MPQTMTLRFRCLSVFRIFAALALCTLVAACQPSSKEAPPASAATTPTPRGPSTAAPIAAPLPTLAQVAQQPQPALKPFDFPPIVQDFAPGQLVLHSDPVDVQISRVTYTAGGMEIDAQAAVHRRALGGRIYLNYADKGGVHDDRGDVFRLRDPGDRLIVRIAEAGAAWKLHLVAGGYLSGQAKTMTLALNINTMDTAPTPVELSWPVPPAVADALQGAGAATVEPGRGFSFRVPPVATSPLGYASVRVYDVRWLRDGIAVDLEVRNLNRDGRISINSAIWSLQLVDDKNHRYTVVEPPDGGRREFRIPPGERMAGRLLFSPRIAPDAARLRLLLNSGPRGDDAWATVAAADDNMHAPRVALDLGIIPAGALPPAMPAKDDSKRNLQMAQQLPPTFPTEVSTMDPVARLKKDLGATEVKQGSRVDLPGDVFFDFDKTQLRADAAPTLDKLAELIRRMNRPVQVSGYTDSKGDAAYNLRLSKDRAEAVKAALVARGVDGARITTAGYGKEQPRAPNTHPDGSDNPAGRQFNRRVEVLITGPTS